jgi:hypothetical protein
VKVGIEAWELDWNRKTIVRLGSANEPKDGRRELPDSKFTTALPETALHGDRYAAVAVCFSRGLFGSRPCEPWSAGSGTGLSRMEAENQAMDECHRRLPQHVRNLAPPGDCFSRIMSVLEGILVTLWGAWGHPAMHSATAVRHRWRPAPAPAPCPGSASRAVVSAIASVPVP